MSLPFLHSTAMIYIFIENKNLFLIRAYLCRLLSEAFKMFVYNAYIINICASSSLVIGTSYALLRRATEQTLYEFLKRRLKL